MKMIKKLKEKLAIRNYDFRPAIVDGPVGTIENAVFYSVDGIGDAIVASPIIRALLDNCSGKVYFICSPASQLYVELLKKQFFNIEIIQVDKKDTLTADDIERTATHIKNRARIDVVVNGLGRVSPRFAQLAFLIRPRAVLSVMESAKRWNCPKMLHKSVDYSNLLYRCGISIVDCWGIIAQMIGFNYNRTLLFPVAGHAPVADPYIAVSLAGASWGIISKENAIHICQSIIKHYRGDIFLLASPGIEKICQFVASRFDNVYVTPLPASLETSGVYIKHAEALVTVCSAPVHIAGAFNTPTLTIRGVKQSEWQAVVEKSMEYITPDISINSLDNAEFERCFRDFMAIIR